MKDYTDRTAILNYLRLRYCIIPGIDKNDLVTLKRANDAMLELQQLIQDRGLHHAIN
jgi:hypothetical protein